MGRLDPPGADNINSPRRQFGQRRLGGEGRPRTTWTDKKSAQKAESSCPDLANSPPTLITLLGVSARTREIRPAVDPRPHSGDDDQRQRSPRSASATWRVGCGPVKRHFQHCQSLLESLSGSPATTKAASTNTRTEGEGTTAQRRKKNVKKTVERPLFLPRNSPLGGSVANAASGANAGRRTHADRPRANHGNFSGQDRRRLLEFGFSESRQNWTLVRGN